MTATRSEHGPPLHALAGASLQSGKNVWLGYCEIKIGVIGRKVTLHHVDKSDPKFVASIFRNEDLVFVINGLEANSAVEEPGLLFFYIRRHRDEQPQKTVKSAITSKTQPQIPSE